MKFSVITPAYNASSTILTTIRSVVDQSHQDWELIIVDDGSLDDTAGLAASIRDARVRVISTTHGGVSAARNLALSEARGEIVTLLDADDTAESCWLSSFAEEFARCPGLGVVCCGARVVDGGVPGDVLLPAHGQGLLRGHRCLFLSGTYALRRSLLELSGSFDASMSFGENTDLGFRVVAALSGAGLSSACVDRPLITWHRDTRRTDRRDRDRLESAEHTLDKYASELRAMPDATASLERIAAVNAAPLATSGELAVTQHERCGCDRRSDRAGRPLVAALSLVSSDGGVGRFGTCRAGGRSSRTHEQAPPRRLRAPSRLQRRPVRSARRSTASSARPSPISNWSS